MQVGDSDRPKVTVTVLPSSTFIFAGRQCVGEGRSECVSGVWQHATRGIQSSHRHQQAAGQGERRPGPGALLRMWHQLCHAPPQPLRPHHALQLQVSSCIAPPHHHPPHPNPQPQLQKWSTHWHKRVCHVDSMYHDQTSPGL